MSSSNISTYPYAARQVTIYFGIPTLIIGSFGETMNILVFLSLKTFRENSCAFYLTIMSFVNIGQLITNLLFQIMIRGFSIDWTQISAFYCKFRIYLLQFCTLMSCTCMCLASIDQFFATCYAQFWQQLSNIKLARIITLIYFVIWMLHGIPYVIYIDLVKIPLIKEEACTFVNDEFTWYFHYGFIITLVGFLPVVITMIFGFLAYRNIQNSIYQAVPIVRRELDKQLTTMVLVEIVFSCITTIPYTILYTIMRDSRITKDPIINSRLQLVSAIFFNSYFLHYAVSNDVCLFMF